MLNRHIRPAGQAGGRYFLVYAQQQVSSQTDASSAASIQAALDTASSFQDNSCGVTIGGSWIGAPRVTRQATLALSGGRTTRVAALFQYPDSPVLDTTVRQCIQNLVNLQLSTLGQGWGTAQTLDYNPVTNGDVNWWASGQAASTHTQNAFDLNQQTGNTSSVENPTGPQLASNPGDLNPPSPLPSLNSITTVGIVIGGLAVLYLAWPVLSGISSGISRSQRRSQFSRRDLSYDY